MDYGRVMAALRRRRWLILIAVFGCTALTMVGASRMKREFQATATLMPQEQALDSLKEQLAPDDGRREREELAGREDRLKTVATVISSPSVVGPALKQLHLDMAPSAFSAKMDVKPITSQMLKVTIKDEDPKLASASVNAVVDRFVGFYGDLRSREARRQLDLLGRERGEAERDLQLAGGRLEQFKRGSNISSLPDQLRLGLERSGQMEGDRNSAEARLHEVTAQISTLQGLLDRTPATRRIEESGTQTALVEKLRLDVADLKTNLDKELAVHTDEHPAVQALKQQLAEAQRRLDTESTHMTPTVKIVANPERETLLNNLRDLRREHDGLTARLAALENKLQGTQARMASYNGKDVEMNLLTQRYTLAEQRLNAVSTRLGQVQSVSQQLSSGPAIAVVDRPGPNNPPIDLSQGRTVRLAALAFIMSLAMCVALAIGLEMSDRRVRSVDDVETLTSLPVVSVVPQLPGRGRADSLCLTTQMDPGSHLAESYHFLANHVLRQTSRRANTVIMGATGRPGQGATTALSNLAIALARAGRKVVLVEADLRRPFLHEVFNCSPKPGLSDVIEDRISVQDALRDTTVDNLRVLAGGTTVPDPWSLLLQPSVPAIIQELRESADYIIFNVPSATVFADALCVAPHVDGAILVVRDCENPNGAEQKVRQWLEEVNVPVMGVVFNGVPAQQMDTADFHRNYTARRADVSPALNAPAAPPVRRIA